MTKIFRPIAATVASSLVRDQKTSYQKPQPTFVPYPTPLTPEGVLGTALDNDPKRLKVPAYYNEVVFVSPFAKVHSTDRRALLGNVMRIGSERRRGYGTYTWSKPVMKGTHPSPRDSHSSTAVGSKLYVFGGTDGTSPLNDLFVLDTDTFVWKKISTTGVSLIPRDGHTCSFYKNCFIVMGGEDSGNAYLNDVYILDTETMAWQEVKTTGAELMLRAGHTTISHGKYLVVFGGFSYDHKLFNDVHTLDLRDSVDAERGI
ncbi:hypothetical protein SELMODRAFT_432449 [Selaginella moellendorffii]|uniref:Uncharacterized protein n=1 Tax=Selaginella moellendorffii TaxID=88036 RepID=D8TG15_SELML|nr:hypothetical protein SELMODRAFT_432449 [Selaginella moellendorffii]